MSQFLQNFSARPNGGWVARRQIRGKVLKPFTKPVESGRGRSYREGGCRGLPFHVIICPTLHSENGGLTLNIKEIAKAAGVSVATISRVLNHPEQVLPETREHVLAVMKAQNYTPNWFARGLNLGRTNTIALLVPSIEVWLYQKLIAGIETVARNKRYAVIFCHTDSDPERELDYLKTVESRHIDGVVVVSSVLDGQQLAPFIGTQIPCVHVGRNRVCGFDTQCYIDFEEGAFRLTQHLLSLGHMSVGLLLDERLRCETEQVESGSCRAMQAAGLDGRLSIYNCGSGIQDGYTAGQRILGAEGEPPGALITFTDDQAFGVLKAAGDAGIPVPDRLAVATMTDSAMCSIVSPAVTGVEQPATRLGMVAARMLFDKIEGEELELAAPQEIILQPKLKIRRSCGNRKHIYELFD